MKITHTFLLEEGLWATKGEFFDQQGNPMQMDGSARITHGEELWRCQGTMRLEQMGGGVVEFQNNYEIKPFEEGKDYTGWASSNPVHGKLAGLFVIVDDSIISTISSEDGTVSGIEYVVKVSDYHYRSRGFVFKDNEKISSWAAELVRREGLH